jgi:hypothetical protein
MIPVLCARLGNSRFRIPDFRFPNHSPSGIRNLESGISIWLRSQATVPDVALFIPQKGDAEPDPQYHLETRTMGRAVEMREPDVIVVTNLPAWKSASPL